MRRGMYSIRQVSERTGLSTQLIRKWEQRYQLIQPRRLPNGYRVYSEQDIALIQQVQAFIDQGYSVKNAVLLAIDSNSENPGDLEASSRAQTPLFTVTEVAKGVVNERDPKEFRDETEANVESSMQLSSDAMVQEFVSKLLEFGRQCQPSAIQETLRDIFHRYGLLYCLRSIICPFLIQVGLQWESGKWSEFQEHMASLAVRDFLVSMRTILDENPFGSLLLASCVPYERHEIPVHILLIEASLAGWRTKFLGPSPAQGAIESAVLELRPAKVLLSMSTTAPLEVSPTLLKELDEFAGTFTSCPFFIGGQGVYTYAEKEPLQHIQLAFDIQQILSTSSFVQ